MPEYRVVWEIDIEADRRRLDWLRGAVEDYAGAVADFLSKEVRQ